LQRRCRHLRPPLPPIGEDEERRREKRENRESEKGRERNILRNERKMGLTTLIYPLLTRPGLSPTQAQRAPSHPKAQFFFFFIFYTPHLLSAPLRLHSYVFFLFYSQHVYLFVFLRIFTLIIFFSDASYV